ncbi:MAG: type II secretion system F family protein [bacterium]
MDIQTIMAYMAVFLAVMLPVIAGQLWGDKQDMPKETSFDSGRIPKLFKLARLPIGALCSAGIGSMLEQMNAKKTQELEKRIVIANLAITPQMVYTAQVVYSLALLVFAIIWCVVLGLKPSVIAMAALVAFFIGWVYPATSVESLANKRQQEIIKSLPFAIDLVGSAMRSGLDFNAAIRYFVSMGIPGALSMEFGIMLKQIELGKTRVEALSNMAERVNTQEFTTFVGAVAHGTEIGASIVDTMVIQSEEMRRARFNLAEQKAQRAPSLMILPMALFIMPSVFIIIFVPVYLKIQASGMGSMMSK